MCYYINMKTTTLALLMLTACGTATEIDYSRKTDLTLCDVGMRVEISEDVPDAVYAQTIAAMRAWNHAAGREVFSETLVGVPVVRITYGSGGAQGEVATTRPLADSNGCIQQVMLRVFDNLWTSLPADMQQTAIRHELGHALGLEHATLPHYLMSAQLDSDDPHPLPVTPSDIQAAAL